MKTKLKLIALLLAASMLTSCGPAEVKETMTEENFVYVKTESISKMDFHNKIVTSGKLNPKEKVSVTSKVAGTVKGLSSDLGKEVSLNQQLAKIDDTTYRLQYDSAKINVQNSQNTISRMKNFEDNTMKPQEIEGAEKQYETAKINFANIETNYNNLKKLYESGAVSKSEFDAIQTQYNLAKMSLDSANEALKQANRNYNYNLKGSQIGLETAKNSLSLADENLKNTTIKAPISGIISKKNINIGQNINPGEVLFEVVNISEFYVDTGVSEKDISSIKVGQTAKVRIDSYGDEIFQGTITNVNPVVDEQTKTYPIKIVLPNKDKKLKAGMFANIEIIIDTHENSLAVPKEIVSKENNSYYIYVLNGDVANKQKIEVGYASEKYYEVLSGITETDKIITVGYDTIEDGQKVKIANE